MFKPYADAFDGQRHTASTIMILESPGTGFGLVDVMKDLGRSKMETTLRCVHPDFERMKIGLDTVARKGYNPALKKARKE
jgi:hypothetical protein